MSDFDKEAERERLREKYEAEEEDREATQHMSELLLKGATMTNSHCGTCGDPIFRYDGQEFCPTCQTQAGAGGETATADDARPQSDAAPQKDARQQSDAAPQTGAAPQNDVARQDATPTTAQRTTAADRTDQPANDAPATDAPGANASAADAPVGDTEPASNAPATGSADRQPATGAGDGSRVRVDGDAVANVEATVERFAAAAANTDDPERAREYLAAVRDATDTLRALRGDAR